MKFLNFGRGMNFDIKKIFNMNMNSNCNRGNNRCNANVISCDEAYEMIKNDNTILIIDVRSRQEYLVSHVINSINIPVCNLYNCLKLLPKDKNTKIFLYCLNGSRAIRAASILYEMGYRNIYMWEGGSITTMPYGELIEYNK